MGFVVDYCWKKRLRAGGKQRVSDGMGGGVIFAEAKRDSFAQKVLQFFAVA